MSIPEHLWRFPTAAAVASLAHRFELPNHPGMQDWPWEVADPERLDEFLAAYEDPSASDDERFVLMEMLLQSFEMRAREHGFDARWTRTLATLDQNVALHAYSIWYWSSLDGSEDLEDHWLVTPDLRRILEKHRPELEKGGKATR
jgi:hypothetical protein